MIYLGADHAGFKLKEHIKEYLQSKKLAFEDMGNFQCEEGDDYPDFGYKVAKAVAKEEGARGILICGTSFGICIVADKVKGVRAVSINSVKDAKIARIHNDANVLCLSGWHLKPKLAEKIVWSFLITKFSNAPRHLRRLEKIRKYES